MKLRILNARVVDTSSPHHRKIVDLQIRGDIVEEIGPSLSRETVKSGDERVVDLKEKWVTPGWIALGCQFGEPGLEYRETMLSGLECALSGGFTKVVLLPNTAPPLDGKPLVEYLLSIYPDHPVHIEVMGALSAGCQGEQLSEMGDMHHSGVSLFSDGLNPVQDGRLLLRALEYQKGLGGIVVQMPADRSMELGGCMHEGDESTRLGVVGIPALAEETMVERDLSILGYCGGKMHFLGVSSPRAMDLINKAQKRGLAVTCDTPINHLLFTDRDLNTYDTNFKVFPPLRDRKMRSRLLRGVVRKQADAVSIFHLPRTPEEKVVEFDRAAYGTTNLQTAFPALLSLASEVAFETFSRMMSHGVREVLGVQAHPLQRGAPAELSFFDPQRSWLFDAGSNKSKSQNSPFFGKILEGRAVGIVTRKGYRFFEEFL